MARLFKNKAIKAKLAGYEIPDFESKLAKVKTWYEAHENKSLHKKSESQCEQAFNQSFFIEILGYQGFPNPIYTIDPKGNVETSGQKPDAILGYFTEEKRRVIAVVEIKDVNTSLDKSQKREGSLSPVQQAFKYKPQYKECDFVIATNFYEIRLLKDNQLDFESFTLDSLIDPKDNYFQFRKFYYLLCAENFIAKSGETKTLKLLSDIRIEQEQITKEFYRKYKELRQELIKNIIENNPEARLKKNFYTLTVEKAQKIIDRIVLISFFEDKDLLPENSLYEVVYSAEKSMLTPPIWETLKNFFGAIDHGHEKLGNGDGYNGELFKEDEALNKLKIDDEICRKFVELGKYDFSEDLSVNILGHIFEQSISDLEELKSIGEKAAEATETSLKTSKRKKDGIFYTPDYIVDYIVKNSLGKYLEEQEQAILTEYGVSTNLSDENYQKRMKEAYEKYRETLKAVKVLDPACGSGAFLVKVYDFLYAEHQRVASILADLSEGKADIFMTKGYIKGLLEDNIYGVDLNPESVEITKLSLWLKTARKGEKLVSLKNNIKCGNSLIDDPAIAGVRAFKWEEEFPEIMKSGGFDVVVGNPPYVLCQPSNTASQLLDFFKNRYKVASYKIDLFHLFIEKSVLLLKKKGYFGVITPNTYLTNKYIEKLRAFILKNSSIREIVLFDDDVFEDASVDTAIIILEKSNQVNNTVFFYKMNSSGVVELKNNVSQVSWEKDAIFNVYADSFYQLTNCVKLKEIAKTYFGIQAFDRKSSIAEEKISNTYLEIVDGEDIKKYSYAISRLYFNFIKENIKSGGDVNIYAKDRIVIPQIGKFPKAGLIKKGILTSNTIYNLYLTTNRFEIKYILAILNSSFTKIYWVKNFSDNKKTFPKIKGYQLLELPIPQASHQTQKSLSNNVDSILNYTSIFQHTLQKSLTLLKHEFQLEKISQKLEKFYQLDFDAFIKALGIKKLDLQKKSELLDFFEKNKKELLDLKAQIDQEDQTIDDMVYELYGLTEEEIKIVESSVNPRG